MGLGEVDLDAAQGHSPHNMAFMHNPMAMMQPQRI